MMRLETLTGLEVGEREAGEAGEIAVVPARIGSADQAVAHAVVGQDDSIVAKSRDDDGRLRAGGRAGRRWHGSFQALDFSRGAGHGAGGVGDDKVGSVCALSAE